MQTGDHRKDPPDLTAGSGAQARRDAQVERWSQAFALAASAIGALALLGWALHIVALTSVSPGWSSMKPNTAIGFVMAGASLSLLAWRSPARGGGAVALARALAGAVGVLALLTLSEYAFNWELRIDQWLFADPGPSANPGRMAPATALNFALASAALLLLDVEVLDGRRPSNWLMLLVAVNVYFHLLGFLYGVHVLYAVKSFNSMSPNSALAFLLLSLSAFCARPGSRLITQIIGHNAAGRLNRLLLPAAVGLPPLLGWLRWQGELKGYYETPMGLAIFTASNVLIFSGLTWWAARAQGLNELSQATYLAKLEKSEARLREAQRIGQIGDWDYDLESGKVTWSEEVYTMYERDPALGPPSFESIQAQWGAEDSERVERHLAHVASTAETRAYEVQVTLPSGRVADHAAVAAPIQNPLGRVIGIRGTVQDISARKQAEAVLMASEIRLRSIIDNEPECVKLLAADGSLLEMNPAGLRMVEAESFEDVENQSLYPLVVEEYRPALEALSEQVFAGGSGHLEFQIIGLKGGRRWLETHASPLRDASGEVIAFLGITRDTTERKAAQQQLLESERRLRRVLDGLGPHMFVGLMDPGGVLLMANKPTLEAASLEESDFVGKRPEDTYFWSYSDAAQQRVREAIRRAAAGERIRVDEKIRVAEGKLMWIDFSIQPVHDSTGLVTALVPSAVVIDERKRVEQELREAIVRQKRLATRLVEVQEAEQRQLSAELHDRIGQNLTALSINLNIIGSGVQQNAAAAVRLQDSQELLEITIGSVRDLLSELRPPALEDYGLLAGLHWHADRLQQRTGLVISVSGEEPSPRLEGSLENALFRIAQEALTNVVKHSRAATASVVLGQQAGVITLEISDDGQGFERPIGRRPDDQQGWGMEMMRERAQAVGAELHLHSTPGVGTHLTISVPPDDEHPHPACR